MKLKSLLLSLLMVSFAVFGQQNINDLRVKNLTNTNTATFNTTYSGVAKLTSGVLSASSLVNADISASAAIAYSKLAAMSTGYFLCGNAGTPSVCQMTGGATIGATGVITLGNSAVITQLLTGYTAAAGTVTSADTLISAIQKIDGNDQLKQTRSTITTAGDFYIGTGSGTTTRLGATTNGEVITVDSGATNKVAYKNPHNSKVDDFLQFKGVEDITNWTKGNNASYWGAGTMAGTFAYETSSPFNGTVYGFKRSYKYTQASGSLNDYAGSTTYQIPKKYRGRFVYLKFPYCYDGNSGDIAPVVYDVTTSTQLVNYSTITTFTATGSNCSEMVFNYLLPLAGDSINVGFQVKALNNGKIFEFGDVSLSTDLGGSVQSNPFETTWAPCTFSTLAWQGVGTVVNQSLECRRNGPDLLMRGRVDTSASVTGSVAQFLLPNNYGTITAKSTANVLYGNVKKLSGSTATLFNAIGVASANYYTIGGPLVSSSNNPVTAITGTAIGASEALVLENIRIPISEWTNLAPQFSGISSERPVIVAKTNSFTTVANTDYKIPLDTISSNTGTYALSSNGVPIKQPGKYRVKLKGDFGANGEGIALKLVVTGTSSYTVVGLQHIVDTNGNGSRSMFEDNFIVDLKVGDILNFYALETTTGRAGTAAEMVIEYVDPYAILNANISGVVRTEYNNNFYEDITIDFGTTNATTVCSGTPCSYVDFFNSLMSPQVTRSASGSYGFSVNRTCKRLKFIGGSAETATTFADLRGRSCANCSSTTFITSRTTDGVAADSFGTVTFRCEY